jgi:hypothetical protein
MTEVLELAGTSRILLLSTLLSPLLFRYFIINESRHYTGTSEDFCVEPVLPWYLPLAFLRRGPDPLVQA